MNNERENHVSECVRGDDHSTKEHTRDDYIQPSSPCNTRKTHPTTRVDSRLATAVACRYNCTYRFNGVISGRVEFLNIVRRNPVLLQDVQTLVRDSDLYSMKKKKGKQEECERSTSVWIVRGPVCRSQHNQQQKDGVFAFRCEGTFDTRRTLSTAVYVKNAASYFSSRHKLIRTILTSISSAPSS
jgi:hypothetical protein